eukprot:6200960-Pleurochrysis_carterae.AAC.2
MASVHPHACVRIRTHVSKYCLCAHVQCAYRHAEIGTEKAVCTPLTHAHVRTTLFMNADTPNAQIPDARSRQRLAGRGRMHMSACA